jgi:hypothetical protein
MKLFLPRILHRRQLQASHALEIIHLLLHKVCLAPCVHRTVELVQAIIPSRLRRACSVRVLAAAQGAVTIEQVGQVLALEAEIVADFVRMEPVPLVAKVQMQTAPISLVLMASQTILVLMLQGAQADQELEAQEAVHEVEEAVSVVLAVLLVREVQSQSIKRQRRTAAQKLKNFTFRVVVVSQCRRVTVKQLFAYAVVQR